MGTLRKLELTDNRYGSFVIAEEVERTSKLTRWRGRCDCGAMKEGDGSTWIKGRIGCQSCGARPPYEFHDESVSLTRAKTRCYNPKCDSYPRYGGRGIIVADRYLHGESGMTGLECLIADIGRRPPRHTLDRINPNGNYAPGNLRWLTVQGQNRNRTNNATLTVGGKAMTLAEWSEASGVNHQTISERLKRGQSHEDAVRPVSLACVATPTGSTRSSNAKLLAHDGKELCVREWSIITGINADTIEARLRAGWTAHKALTKPSGRITEDERARRASLPKRPIGRPRKSSTVQAWASSKLPMAA